MSDQSRTSIESMSGIVQTVIRDGDQHIDPVIAEAIEQWVKVAIHERRGRGKAHEDGSEGYLMSEYLELLYELAPDAIVKMLNAGADKYLGSAEEAVEAANAMAPN